MKKVFLFTLFMLFIAPKNTSASTLGLSLSPSLITINTANTDPISKQIHVKNNTDHNISYTIAIYPFTPSTSGNGQPILQENVNQEYNTLFRAIQISEDGRLISSVELSPGQEKILNFLFNPASSLPSKDYYFTILFTSNQEEPTQSSSVRISQSAGINFLLTYGYQNEASGKIKEFTTSSFIDKGPVEFKASVTNSSQSYTKARGNIQVKNIFGQTVGSIDLPSVDILGNSNRSLDSVWDESFLLGIYTAKLQIALSPSGPILTKEIKFAAIPLSYLVALIAITLFASYIAIRVSRKRSQN